MPPITPQARIRSTAEFFSPAHVRAASHRGLSPGWNRFTGWSNLLIIAAVASGVLACSSTTAAPEDYVYRARIDDCRITTPQLATVFRIGERLMVSAAHPFEGIRSFELFDADGGNVEADLIALRSDKDLALLRLRDPLPSPAVGLATESVPRDSAVQIITFDREGVLVVKNGLVVRRANVTLDGEDPRKAIELEAEIEAGDSGAPVLFDGSMVGVVFAASRVNESGWAVSVPEVRTLVEAQPEDSDPLVLGCDAG